MADLVVGADGGNSKTDLVLADTGGRLLAWVRGIGTRPHADGMAVTAGQLADLTRRGLSEAGLPETTSIAVGAYFLANVDVPADEQEALLRLSRLDVAERTLVRNDTLAILRAGAPEGWGVAVVSGAGINAVGVHPGGRSARFLSLGDITGDWGGGMGVARAAMGAAVRAGDGRGPATVLREVLPGHFGLPSVETVALAVSAGEIPAMELPALAPLVFAAADDGDAVAREIVTRLGDEIVTMVTALLRRLDLLGTPTPVVLGGGTLQNDQILLHDHIRRRLGEEAPLARPQVLDVPPVAGAACEALMEARAPQAAWFSLREALAGTRPPPPTRGEARSCPAG
ncbi:ATPase [Actinoallomurus purpureus]|uniref:N-acetylglucosamine kinase n=1 Tax=Actinoallomurus purpureus TaxID=478114 RepID=UPI0020924FF8|nr:BadF/BadG/BcrA/BcrD ATPase family protein [Actinoallomurus purpureus]MCO6004234.1 ATPase [Actinoallomurus purpureus]